MRSFLSIILLVSCLNCLSFSLTVIRGQNADKSTSRIPADTFMFILDSAIAYQLFLVGTAPVLGGVYAIGTIGLFIDRLYDNLTAEEKDSKETDPKTQEPKNDKPVSLLIRNTLLKLTSDSKGFKFHNPHPLL